MAQRELLVGTTVVAVLTLLIDGGVCVSMLTSTEYSQGMSQVFGVLYLVPTALAAIALLLALFGLKASRFVVVIPVLMAVPVLLFAGLVAVGAVF